MDNEGLHANAWFACLGPPSKTSRQIERSSVAEGPPAAATRAHGQPAQHAQSGAHAGGTEYTVAQHWEWVGPGRDDHQPILQQGQSEAKRKTLLLYLGECGCFLCILLCLCLPWLMTPELAVRRPAGSQLSLRSPSPSEKAPPQDGQALDLVSVIEELNLYRQVTGPYQVFAMSLDHSAGLRFGFRLTSEYNSLFIDTFSARGGSLVDGWNAEHPAVAVATGDRIIAVNRVHGTAPRLLQELDARSVLDVEVLRVTAGSLVEPHPVTFSELLLDRSHGEAFGAELVQTSSTLVVKRIKGGLFETWNKGMPENLRIFPGDRILAVNGVEGSSTSLLAECTKLKVLELKFARGRGSYRAQLHEDVVSTAPWGCSYVDALQDEAQAETGSADSRKVQQT